MKKIGFGGGCHWCTEAVFQSLRGVERVEQGWIASVAPDRTFSEAVIVHYNEGISIEVLIEIHLLTHSSSNDHSMRQKYRSAVYYFDNADNQRVLQKIHQLSIENNTRYITRSLPYKSFRKNSENQINYYLKNRQAPFCRTYINPKLSVLREKYSVQVIDDF